MVWSNRACRRVLVAVVPLLAVAACRSEEPSPSSGRQYVERDLLLDANYLTPDVEGRLTEPEPEFFIDPDEPLDRARFESYLHDQETILEEAVLESARRRVEEILFE